MTMQRRHFELIASVIHSMTGEDFEGLRPVIARRFANELATTNPQFQRDKFLKACGVSDGE